MQKKKIRSSAGTKNSFLKETHQTALIKFFFGQRHLGFIVKNVNKKNIISYMSQISTTNNI